MRLERHSPRNRAGGSAHVMAVVDSQLVAHRRTGSGGRTGYVRGTMTSSGQEEVDSER